MKRYNFFEKLLLTLSWGAWLSMLLLMMITNFYDSAMSGGSVGFVMSIIAMILLLLENGINHYLKFSESDSRNVVFQLAALGYSLIYLVALFLMGFAEDVAWYPLGFLICYFAGGLINILFVLVYNRIEAREKRHFSFSRHHRKKFHFPRLFHKRPKKEAKFSSSNRGDWVSFLNTDAGISSLNDSIQEKIKKDVPVDIGKSLSIFVDSKSEKINQRMKMYFSEEFQVIVTLDESDENWFFEYVKKMKGKKLFEKTKKIFIESGVSIDFLADPDLYTSDKKIQEKIQNAAEEEFQENCIFALEQLKKNIEDVLKDKLACSSNGIMWLGYSHLCDDYSAMKNIPLMQLKKDCANFYRKTGKIKDVYISKAAKFEIETKELKEVIDKNISKGFSLFVEMEKAAEERSLLDANSRKYYILDSKDGKKHLATSICLYLCDRLEEMNPGKGCLPFADLPMRIKASNLISDSRGKCYGTLTFDISFSKKDGEYFESFCQAVCLGYPIEKYEKKGQDFVMKHINKAIEVCLKNVAPLMVGVRPKDTSSEYWSSLEPKGEEPIRIANTYRLEVLVHWESIPWDASCWHFNLP